MNHIERLTLEVRVPDAADALALRDRVEQLADGAISDVMQRTLDELCPTDVGVSLDKIELDLGVLDPDRLETDVPIALERALREALSRALAEALKAGGGARAAQDVRLEDFELFLVRGVAPFGTDGRPLEDLRALIAGQPRSLSRMLHRRASARYALERLALLADDAAFADLLAILAPADVAVILAYMAELGQLYPASTAPPLANPLLKHILRVLTLEYLLRDPGGVFNRKRYAESLLRGLALRHGLAYHDLLKLLLAALPATRRRRPLAGSLLEVLAGLADEAAEREPASSAPSEDPVAQAVAGDLDPLLAALRSAISRPARLDQLVRRLERRTFARVIAVLEPAHAEVILTYTEGLSQAHASQPILPLSESAFEVRLRRLALRFLLNDAGSSFNRQAWLRRLLTGLSRESGVSYTDLLAALTAVIETLKSQTPPRGQLPIALSALAADLPRSRAPHRAVSRRRSDAAASPSDHLAAAEQFLRTGSPSAAAPELATIAARHPTAFAALLRRLTRAASNRPDVLTERLFRWIAPDTVAEILWPGRGEAAARWADDLVETEGLDMASAWERVAAAGLTEKPLPPRPRSSPDLSRTVRDALLRHWLDHGTLTWWAPPGVTVEVLLGDLAGRPVAALAALFDDHDPARVTARLQRATAALREKEQPLLQKLAPWAFERGRVEATFTRNASDTDRAAFHLRAAAAAVTGGPLDLTTPLPPAPHATTRPEETPCEDAHMLAWVSGDGPAVVAGAAAAIGQKLARSRRRDRRFDAALRRGLARAQARERLAGTLLDSELTLLAWRLAPGLARLLHDLIAVLARVSRDPERARRTLWTLALGMLLAPPAPSLLAERLIAGLATGSDREALKVAAATAARRHGHAHLTALLAPSRSSGDRPTPRDTESAAPEPGETFYVANAGLVIFNPFLPRLFEGLAVLGVDAQGDQRIVGLEAASKAVHALQYLVDGRTDAPEPELLLNKLLCGLSPELPIQPSVDLSDGERGLCDSLLKAVIANWKIISDTSTAGLRETFLQREGRLQRGEDRWSLEVQRKTLDVLTDQIPWSLAVVYHRWMPDPVHVTW